MSDQITPPAPGPGIPALTPTATPAPVGDVDSGVLALMTQPPAVTPPVAVKKAPRILNPYAAKVAPPVAVDPRIAELQASNAEHLATLSGYAMTELESAPEALRNAVKALAGTNPSAQLKALATLRAHGLGVATLSPGASTSAASKPHAKAAPAVSQEDSILARYTDLKARGANLLAAQFRSQNSAAIAKAMASKSNN